MKNAKNFNPGDTAIVNGKRAGIIDIDRQLARVVFQDSGHTAMVPVRLLCSPYGHSGAAGLGTSSGFFVGE